MADDPKLNPDTEPEADETVDGAPEAAAPDEEAKAPPAETAAAGEQEPPKKQRATVSAEVTKLQERVQKAEAASNAAEAKLTELNKRIEDMARGTERSRLEQEASGLEAQISTLTGKLEAANKRMTELVTPEEAARRAKEEADKAAGAVRGKAKEKESELEGLLAGTRKEVDDLKAQVAKLTSGIEDERKSREAAVRTASHAEALVILKDAGLRPESVALAKRVIADVYEDGTNLADADARKALVARFREQFPVLFGDTKQSTAGLPPKGEQPQEKADMSAWIRAQAGG
jgi:predicted  nucleic acid-binding Zn-ribbon protein